MIASEINKLKVRWRNPRQQLWIAIFVLSLLSMAQYFPSLDGEFIWDGNETFLNDPSIRDFGYFSSYFTEGVASHLEKQGTATESLGYYRPVIRTLHFFEFKLFGENPKGYHAVSVGLNLLVVLVAFLVVRAITQEPLVALLSAIIFAVNPSHVEAVSWAYSDSYLVFSLFCLLSFYFHLNKMTVWSLLSFAVALLSQESAVLFPVVLVLERYLVSGKRRFRDYVFIAPYLSLLIIFLIMRMVAVGGLPVSGLDFLPWLNAISTILISSVKIFFMPDAAIALYHNKPGMFEETSVSQAFIYLAVTGLCFIGVWLWRNKPDWFFWYLWFFVWLAVMFNVGEFAQFYFMDKILYLGSLGFCVLLAKFFIGLRVKSTIVGGTVACYVVFYFSVSLWREAYYVDEKTYFEKAVVFTPDFPLLRYSTGMMYLDREEYGNAEKEFELTLKFDPNHSYAHNNIGNILFMRSDFTGAINSWRRAINADSTNPQPYYNIGAAYERQNNFQQAVSYYQQYLKRQPNPPAGLLYRIQQMKK